MVEKIACVTLGKRRWKRVEKSVCENLVFKYEMPLKEVKDDDYIHIFPHNASRLKEFEKLSVANNYNGKIIFYAMEKPNTSITINICRMNWGD